MSALTWLEHLLGVETTQGQGFYKPTTTDLLYPNSYNVLTYGADATGILDSSDAFSSAFTSAATNSGNVIIPTGTYKISNTININLGSSANLNVAVYGSVGSSDTTLIEVGIDDIFTINGSTSSAVNANMIFNNIAFIFKDRYAVTNSAALFYNNVTNLNFTKLKFSSCFFSIHALPQNYLTSSATNPMVIHLFNGTGLNTNNIDIEQSSFIDSFLLTGNNISLTVNNCLFSTNMSTASMAVQIADIVYAAKTTQLTFTNCKVNFPNGTNTQAVQIQNFTGFPASTNFLYNIANNSYTPNITEVLGLPSSPTTAPAGYINTLGSTNYNQFLPTLNFTGSGLHQSHQWTTPGTYTFTLPSTTSLIIVSSCGGGGGGGGGQNATTGNNGGGGGGAGFFGGMGIGVTGGHTFELSVGAGGTGGAVGINGGNGGNTTLTDTTTNSTIFILDGGGGGGAGGTAQGTGGTAGGTVGGTGGLIGGGGQSGTLMFGGSSVFGISHYGAGGTGGAVGTAGLAGADGFCQISF